MNGLCWGCGALVQGRWAGKARGSEDGLVECRMKEVESCGGGLGGKFV